MRGSTFYLAAQETQGSVHNLRLVTEIARGGGSRGREDPCEELEVPAAARAPTQQLLLT